MKYIYIYIYIERERERYKERKRHGEKEERNMWSVGTQKTNLPKLKIYHRYQITLTARSFLGSFSPSVPNMLHSW